MLDLIQTSKRFILRESLQEDHDGTHSKNTYITITEIQHPQAQETHHQQNWELNSIKKQQ